MRITASNALTAEQADSVSQLYTLCAAYDGITAPLTLDSGMNFDTGLPAFYLGMEGEELAAFLMIYAPSAAVAEVTAFVAPKYRKQRRFSALLAEASARLGERRVGRILVLCDAASADGRAAMAALGAHYETSEYSMIRSLAQLPATDIKLRITEAEPHELYELSLLAAEIFNGSPAHYQTMLGKAIAAPAMTVYSAWLGWEHAGICRVIWDEQPPSIYTLGIRPDLRGRGLGEALLHLVLGEIVSRGHDAAELDVNSGNTAAFALYRKAGFQIKSQIDYYTISNKTKQYTDEG